MRAGMFANVRSDGDDSPAHWLLVVRVRVARSKWARGVLARELAAASSSLSHNRHRVGKRKRRPAPAGGCSLLCRIFAAAAVLLQFPSLRVRLALVRAARAEPISTENPS